MILVLLFLLIPLVEIALFIQVGGLIGLWPTLLTVVLTAILGAWLVRTEGLGALERLRSGLRGRDDPAAALADGALILLAGAFLLTPGFFTDAVGFLLVIPTTRAIIKRLIARHWQFQSVVWPEDDRTGARVTIIEGEIVTPDDPGSSPTRH
ncbi:MAG: FxsA family protein [Alphaproteobacteria bacterium]|nr:MAG: FxsA family protein [Alphaproteobacteria bacterium]